MKKIKNYINKIRVKFMNKNKYIEYLRKLGVKIGTNCEIDKTAYFLTEPYLIRIGDGTRISRNVQFITHDGGLWTLRKMGLVDHEAVKYGTIEIGKNCNISWNVIIMPNVKIGDNVVIAAGAIVTKNIPSNTVWGGVPAKQIETIEEYYCKVKNNILLTNSMSYQKKKKILSDHFQIDL